MIIALLSKLFKPRGGKRQRSSLSAIINERVRDGVIEKRPKRVRKPQQKSELDRRLRSICTKLGRNQNGSKRRQDCRFHGRQLRSLEAETSAKGKLLCSGPHSY